MKYFIVIVLSVVAYLNLSAQNLNTKSNNNLVLIDSLAKDSLTLAPVLDSSLIGVSVFRVLDSKKTIYSADVTVNQPFYMEETFANFIVSNEDNRIAGYRIRIFFKNSQTARLESEELELEFKEAFPNIPTYRSYTTPYFKISVGNYRTKSDAIQRFDSIKELFPNAIIVKDNISYPAID